MKKRTDFKYVAERLPGKGIVVKAYKKRYFYEEQKQRFRIGYQRRVLSRTSPIHDSCMAAIDRLVVEEREREQNG